MKNALDKAKSGLLVVNASEIDSLTSQNAGVLAKAHMGSEERFGAAEVKPNRLSQEFGKQKKQKDDGFGLWVLAMMASNTFGTLSPPTYDHS